MGWGGLPPHWRLFWILDPLELTSTSAVSPLPATGRAARKSDFDAWISDVSVVSYEVSLQKSPDGQEFHGHVTGYAVP